MERPPELPERLPEGESLDDIRPGGVSLTKWHEYLTNYDGFQQLPDKVVISRYGDTQEECAWWALAGNYIAAAITANFDPRRFHLRGIRMLRDAVMDNPDLYELVLSAWDDVPAALVEKLNNAERPRDEYLIWQVVKKHLEDGSPIGDAAARMIAASIHSGQTSPLYAFASTGELVAGLQAEIAYNVANTEKNWTAAQWAAALGTYIMFERNSPEPVEGWSKLWLGEDR